MGFRRKGNTNLDLLTFDLLKKKVTLKNKLFLLLKENTVNK